MQISILVFITCFVLCLSVKVVFTRILVSSDEYFSKNGIHNDARIKRWVLKNYELISYELFRFFLSICLFAWLWLFVGYTAYLPLLRISCVHEFFLIFKSTSDKIYIEMILWCWRYAFLTPDPVTRIQSKIIWKYHWIKLILQIL